MICGMTYFEILWYFVIYSFVGWIVEVVYHAASWGQIINRGFLNGPLCPVYGFGVVAVFAMVKSLDSAGIVLSDICLFLLGCLIATVVELVSGWLLDVCFHARWWDYSKKPLNFKGYICLEFSLIWGLSILLVVKTFQTYVEYHTAAVDVSTFDWIILAVIYALLFADLAVTVAVVNGLNKRLSQLDKIGSDMRILSDKLSEKVGGKTIDTAIKVGEGRVQAALARAELRDKSAAFRERGFEFRDRVSDFRDKGSVKLHDYSDELRKRLNGLKREYDDTADSLTRNKWIGYGRLLAAFPQMKPRKNQGVLQRLREWKVEKDQTEKKQAKIK